MLSDIVSPDCTPNREMKTGNPVIYVLLLLNRVERIMEIQDYSIMESKLLRTLGLSRRPVVLAFRDAPPAGIPKFAGQEPSGCSFWRLAAQGMTFYTVPQDHANCALGSYAYRYDVSPEHTQELANTFSQLADSGYIQIGNISAIPRMQTAPQAVIYSPLGETPIEPDLVIFVIRLMPAMILQEAALRMGIAMDFSSFGTPACMSLTTALSKGMASSTGCLGNRVFVDLGDDELYVLLAGNCLPKIVDAIQGISESNQKIKEFHRQRQRILRASLE
jgi:uncharacterized protein (DUF169 family)